MRSVRAYATPALSAAIVAIAAALVITSGVAAPLERGGTGDGSQGGGGGSGPSFDVEAEDDSVVVSSGGQSWTLSEDQLEAVVDGTTTLPQPLVDAVVGQGGSVDQLAQKLLSLLH